MLPTFIKVQHNDIHKSLDSWLFRCILIIFKKFFLNITSCVLKRLFGTYNLFPRILRIKFTLDSSWIFWTWALAMSSCSWSCSGLRALSSSIVWLSWSTLKFSLIKKYILVLKKPGHVRTVGPRRVGFSAPCVGSGALLPSLGGPTFLSNEVQN